MNDKEIIDHIKFVIGRYDFYYDSINNKANFWLAFNTFAIGVVLTTYKDVKEIVPSNVLSWFNFELIVFLLITIAASLLILKASWPHLNTRQRASLQSRSLIYFDDVSAIDLIDLQNAFDTTNDLQLKNDFTSQVHLLANGLSRKYQTLAIAGRLMAVSIVTIAILIATVVIGNFF